MSTDPNRSGTLWCRVASKPRQRRIIACGVGYAIAPNDMARSPQTFVALLLMASLVACQIEALRCLYALSKRSKRVSMALSAKDCLIARGIKRDVWVLLCFVGVGVVRREISSVFGQGVAARCVAASLFGAAAVFVYTVAVVWLARRVAWVEMVVASERAAGGC